ncbi:MAG: hypothetical protein E6J56_23300 [Deltaproteobacteria bacterium]|nr:MAG: hypothetical protein E6J56_23300 [Deltaproteobacteria bacterium]
MRHFTTFKAKARRGERVRILDREGEFIFAAATPRKSLLGAARGKMEIRGDLTKPTLGRRGWKPSL